MHYRKIEFKIPVFFGCLGALILCAQLAIRWPEPVQSFETGSEDLVFQTVKERPVAVKNVHFFTTTEPQRCDFILKLYRQPESQGRVVDFFTEICPTPEIAEIILANADEFDVSPALAFALSWEESRFNPRAVNDKNRNESIDRGLFQLNDRSFPRLEIAAFFDPELNAYFGIGHLRHCLDIGGTEIAALAMYNAGTNRVSNAGTPKTTLDYISRILENRQKIETRFLEREDQYQAQLEEIIEIVAAEPEPERSRFALLKLLGIR